MNKIKTFLILLCFVGMLGCQFRTYYYYNFSKEVFSAPIGTLTLSLNPTYSIKDEDGKRVSVYQSPYRLAVQYTSTNGEWSEFALTDLLLTGLEDETTKKIGSAKGMNKGNRRQDLGGLYFGAFETQPIELNYQPYGLSGNLVIREGEREVFQTAINIIFKTDYKKKIKSDVISAMEGI